MTLEFRNIILLILSSIFISCNGQVKNEKQLPTVQKVSEVNKIAVPEYGFSSGLLDNKGNLWFASMPHGGVSRFDGDKFTNFSINDGLSDDMVRTIFSDKSGNLRRQKWQPLAWCILGKPLYFRRSNSN